MMSLSFPSHFCSSCAAEREWSLAALPYYFAHGLLPPYLKVCGRSVRPIQEVAIVVIVVLCVVRGRNFNTREQIVNCEPLQLKNKDSRQCYLTAAFDRGT